MTTPEILSIPFLFCSLFTGAIAFDSWRYKTEDFVTASCISVVLALIGLAVGGWLR